MELWQKLKTNTGQLASNIRQAQERYREELHTSKHSSNSGSKEDVSNKTQKNLIKTLLVIDSHENNW